MLGKLCPLIFVVAFYCGAPAGATEITPYLMAADGKPETTAGLRLDDGFMSIRADVAVNSESAATKALPRISSELAISERIGFVTSVKLPDWNGGASRYGAIFDTRLHFEPGSPFVDRIEGRLHRAPNGLERQSLKLGFSDTLAWPMGSSRLAFKGSAIVEGTTEPGSDDSLAMGIEARLYGFDVPALGLGSLGLSEPSGSISLNVRREAGAMAQTERLASVAYDHSWAFLDSGQLGLTLEASRSANRIEPVLGLSWQAAF